MVLFRILDLRFPIAAANACRRERLNRKQEIQNPKFLSAARCETGGQEADRAVGLNSYSRL
jgi:hypothetical protein